MAKKVKKPKSKTRKIIEGVITGIVMAILGFVAVSLITGMVFKRHGVSMMFNQVGSCYVLTDSMDPVYPEKSTILVQKCSPQELIKRFDNGEDVDVTFSNVDRGIGPVIPEGKNPSDLIVTNQIMTHRLIGYWVDENGTEGNGKYYFFASGINYAAHIGGEGQYQVFTEVDLVGRVVGKSQFLGLMTQFITSWYGLLVLLLIPSAYMIITSVLDIFRAYQGDDEEENNDKVVAEVDGKASTVPSGENGDVLGGLSDKDKERLKQELLDEMLNKKKGD